MLDKDQIDKIFYNVTPQDLKDAWSGPKIQATKSFKTQIKQKSKEKTETGLIVI